MASAAHPPSRRYGFRPGCHAVRIKHQNRPGFGVISGCSPRAAHGESTKARNRKQSKKGKGSAGSFERQAETVGSVVSGPGEIRLCRGEDRAELGHGLSSALVAEGNGFTRDGGAGSIRVPLKPSARENHFAGIAENHLAK